MSISNINKNRIKKVVSYVLVATTFTCVGIGLGKLDNKKNDIGYNQEIVIESGFMDGNGNLWASEEEYLAHVTNPLVDKTNINVPSLLKELGINYDAYKIISKDIDFETKDELAIRLTLDFYNTVVECIYAGYDGDVEAFKSDIKSGTLVIDEYGRIYSGDTMKNNER